MKKTDIEKLKTPDFLLLRGQLQFKCLRLIKQNFWYTENTIEILPPNTVEKFAKHLISYDRDVLLYTEEELIRDFFRKERWEEIYLIEWKEQNIGLI